MSFILNSVAVSDVLTNCHHALFSQEECFLIIINQRLVVSIHYSNDFGCFESLLMIPLSFNGYSK